MTALRDDIAARRRTRILEERRDYIICGAAMGYATRWFQLGLEKRPRMRNQLTHLAYAAVFAIAGSSVYNFNAKNETLLYRRLTALSERHEAERAYALRKAEAEG